MYFKTLEENLKKPGRISKNSKNLEEIQKTWRKFPKNLWPPWCIYIYNNRELNFCDSYEIETDANVGKYLTMFGKADIDMKVALGTFVLNSVYSEAEAEFQQTGYFKTRINLKNSTTQSHPNTNDTGFWTPLKLL